MQNKPSTYEVGTRLIEVVNKGMPEKVGCMLLGKISHAPRRNILDTNLFPDNSVVANINRLSVLNYQIVPDTCLQNCAL